VNVYRVLPHAASSITEGGEVPDGGLMVAVRLADLVTPLRNGRLPGGGCRSALVIGGTRWLRTGEPAVFCKVTVSRRRRSGGTGGCRRRAARFITRRWGRWRNGWRRRPGRA